MNDVDGEDKIPALVDEATEACRSILEYVQSDDIRDEREQRGIASYYHTISGGINAFNHFPLGGDAIAKGMKGVRMALKNLSPAILEIYQFSENTHTVLIDVLDSIGDIISELHRQGELGDHEYQELTATYNENRQFLATPISEKGPAR